MLWMILPAPCWEAIASRVGEGFAFLAAALLIAILYIWERVVSSFDYLCSKGRTLVFIGISGTNVLIYSIGTKPALANTLVVIEPLSRDAILLLSLVITIPSAAGLVFSAKPRL